MIGEIFLTGAGGYLGSKILKALAELKQTRISLIGESALNSDPYPKYGISELSTRQHFRQDDVLVLCGAQYYKGSDLSTIQQMRAYNVDYTLKIVDAFVSKGGKFIVTLSSYMQLYRNKSPHRPVEYVQTKQIVYEYVASVGRVSLLNLYLYDNWSADDQREKFVPKLLDALTSGADFRIPYPDILIDIADANSLAGMIAHLIISQAEGSYSLATFRPVRLLDVASKMSSYFESNANIIMGDRHFSEPLPYIDAIEVAKIMPHSLIEDMIADAPRG